MASAATFEELRHYAETGRLGGMIDLRADRMDPVIGTTVLLRWDFSNTDLPSGVLEIAGVGQMRVPPAGERRVPVGAALMEIRLIAGDEVASLIIEPRVLVPHILDFGARGQATVGESIMIVWRVQDAETCMLVIEDGEHVAEHQVAVNGEMWIVPRNPGVLHVSLIARSSHAHLSDEAIVSRGLELPVKMPPLRIEMPATRKASLLGEEVRFDWTIYGATRAALHLVDRDEIRDVPLDGHMQVAVGPEEERFRLVATGFDGKEKAVEFRVVPRFVSVSQIPTGVSLLSRPWR